MNRQLRALAAGLRLATFAAAVVTDSSVNSLSHARFQTPASRVGAALWALSLRDPHPMAFYDFVSTGNAVSVGTNSSTSMAT